MTISADNHAANAEVTFRAKTSTDKAQVFKLAHLAVASSPADIMLRNAVDSLFTLNHNGRQLPVTGVAASASPQHVDPAALFAQAKPTHTADFAADILSRLDGVHKLGGEKLGQERSSAVGLVMRRKDECMSGALAQ